MQNIYRVLPADTESRVLVTTGPTSVPAPRALATALLSFLQPPSNTHLQIRLWNESPSWLSLFSLLISFFSVFYFLEPNTCETIVNYTSQSIIEQLCFRSSKMGAVKKDPWCDRNVSMTLTEGWHWLVMQDTFQTKAASWAKAQRQHRADRPERGHLGRQRRKVEQERWGWRVRQSWVYLAKHGMVLKAL